MARLNEITSTEKLLDFIRKKDDTLSSPRENPETFAVPCPSPTREAAEFSLPYPGSSFKAVTIGVCIGPDRLWLVKTTKGAEGTPILLNKRQRAIPPSLMRDSAEFTNLLKTELDSFCGKQKKPRIWAIVSSAAIEVGHVRVPKVPKKQLESVVYWAVKKEKPFDENESIFDFQLLGEVSEQGISKWSVMHCRAPKSVIEETKRIYYNAGWPLTGLAIAPFALQNIFRMEYEATHLDSGPVAYLFIGNDFSRIDVFSQGSLVMTRDIKTGLKSMLECLIDGVCHEESDGRERLPVDVARAKSILSSLCPDIPLAEKQEATSGLALIPDIPLPEKPEGTSGLDEEAIWQTILPALERLVRQAERTFEFFSSVPGNEKIKRIYIALAMDACPRFGQYVGEQLNMPCDIFDPLLEYFPLTRNNKISYACDSERIALAPAWGIALSDNAYTPNFLFTFKDKEKESAVKRINMAVFVVFLVVVAFCSGFFAYQRRAVEHKRQAVAKLKVQLPVAETSVDREELTKMLNAVKGDLTSAKGYSQRYLGLAIFSELTQLTPPSIRFINVKVNLGKAAVAAAETSAAAKVPDEMTKTLEIEGFASGERQALNSCLAAYVIKLGSSPLFKQAKVLRTNEETYNNTVLLRFSLTMKVAGL